MVPAPKTPIFCMVALLIIQFAANLNKIAETTQSKRLALSPVWLRFCFFGFSPKNPDQTDDSAASI
jgi:hypothetical protein